MQYKSKNKISIMLVENPQKETIKEIIKNRNLSYRKIADILNISLTKVYRLIKTNRYAGDFELMQKLADLLNSDVNFIFPIIKITQEEKKEILNYYDRIDRYYFRKKTKEMSKNIVYTKSEKKEKKNFFRIKGFIKKIIDIIKQLIFKKNS